MPKCAGARLDQMRGAVDIAGRFLHTDDARHLRDSAGWFRCSCPRRCGPARCTGSPADRRFRRSSRNGGRCLPASACCSTARPAASRPRRLPSPAAVSSIASVVELPPEPAITGIRPAVCSTAVLTISTCSSTDSVADSPLVPTTTSPFVPSATCQSISLRNAGRSRLPSSSIGVMMAGMLPRI